jgi:XTP/dITP diphosphohydrolase
LKPILIATSNPGKLRDFAGAAKLHKVAVAQLPGFQSLPAVEEDGATFAANAIKKAKFYSRYAPEELVLADDSGLEVFALGGKPGVRSARFDSEKPHPADAALTVDAANNSRLLREMNEVPESQRAARFFCVIAAARDGRLLQTFEGEVRGEILRAPRGANGFGYDPLFFITEIGKTTAELAAEEKAAISHRGRAFEKFLNWWNSGQIENQSPAPTI